MRPLDEPVISPTIIGRDVQLTLLEDFLTRGRQTRGLAVLLAGEAGIGKSRLVEAAREVARTRGWGIAQGNFYEQDRALPYAGLTDLIRRHLVAQSEPEATDLSCRIRDLAPLLPEVAHLAGVTGDVNNGEGEWDRRRLVSAFSEFLLAASERQPLLAILEDLHWADDASLDLLPHLARLTATNRVLLLMTYRNDEVHPPLGHLLAGFERERLASEISLQRLPPVDVDQMLRAILGRSRPVRVEVLNAIYSLTDGNPFFVEEVVRSLAQQEGPGVWDDGLPTATRIPRSVEESVQRRTRGLSQSAATVLSLAAVIGRRFDFPLLLRLSGLDEDGLLAAMKELIAAQMVVEASEEQFSFRHALTRHAVYSGLLLRERKLLHRRITEALPLIHAEELAEYYGDLAYHAFQSEDWPEALRFSRLAGDRAHEVFSPTTAVEHFGRALTAAEQVPGADIAPVHRSRGKSYETIGDFDRALADFEAALSLARQAGDRHAEWQALLDIGMVWTGRDYPKSGRYFQMASELAQAMGDRSALAHSLNRVGNWSANIERPREGTSHHVRALNIFEELGDEPGIAATLDLLGTSALMRGEFDESTRYYRRAVALFEKLNDQAGLASTLSILAIRGGGYNVDCCLPVDPLATAAVDGYRSLEIARRIGWRSATSSALWDLAMCLGPAGRYGEALEFANLSLSIAEDIEHRPWQAATESVLGAIYLDLLAIELAFDHLEKASALSLPTGSQLWMKNSAALYARALAASGDVDRAEAVLDPFPTNGDELTQAQRQVEGSRAEVLLARGDGEAALAVLGRLRAEAMTRPVEWRPARLAMLRGEILFNLNQRTEASAAYSEAIAASEAQGRPSTLWRALAGLADLERDSNSALTAALTTRGREVIDRLAVQIPSGELRDDFRSRASRRLKEAPVAAERPRATGLTAREVEIAGLVSRGLSNRVIAETLVLSERTVESHVGNALAKLGFNSRTQLAVWAAGEGHVATP